MAKLDAQERREMPRSEFGMLGSKRFPMEDPVHDREAISGATRSERAGNISASTADRIKAEARAKLGDAPHPREHSLTMASAAHLANKGYISSAHHAAIRADAEKRLAVHKTKSPAAPGAFGSLAPRGPVMDQDQDGY